MSKKKRHALAQEELQELFAVLDRAAADEVGRNTVLDELARHRPSELMLALADYARGRGADALPVLSALSKHEDTNVALAAIDALGFVSSEDAVRILREIEATSTKLGRRAARRSLYRLSLAGLKTEPEARKPQFPTESLGPYKAVATGLIDGHLRLYWIAFQRALGGLNATFAQIDYDMGPVDAFSSDMSSRAFEREIARLQQQEDRYLWAELPFSYACYRIKEASGLALEKGKEIPPNLQRIANLLDLHGQPLEQHPVYNRLSQAEVKLVPDFLAESTQLLHTFRDFVWGSHPPVDLAEEIEDLKKAQESRILLGAEAQQQRLDAIISRAFTKTFLGDRRTTWQLRFEDLAYNLASLGRDRLAKQALSVAVALRAFTETEIRMVPLLKALVAFWLKVDVSQ